MLVAGIASGLDPNFPEARDIEGYFEAIDWNVIFFLIAMFTIVEILNDTLLFHAIAKFIVKKYSHNTRLMFYVLCTVSTLSASIIEDISVAIIFIPIIVLACQEMEINPYPFLLGMTICINLASTLTPFGSAENIMIASSFDLSLVFFIKNLGVYFIVTVAITVLLLDRFVLSKSLKTKYDGAENIPHEEQEEQKEQDESHTGKKTTNYCEDPEKGKKTTLFDDIVFKPKIVRKNLIAFGIFIVFLLVISEIFIAGMLGMILFVFINAKNDKKDKFNPMLSKYLSKLNYKMIYFFICLYILVHLMVINGTVQFFENVLLSLEIGNVFLLSIVILIITSLLSGLMDNAPVTIMFLPIITYLTGPMEFAKTPILLAFILGINLGGNFLPQGSAADMMTLELGQQYCVFELTYRKLTKVGSAFALLHVVLGIGYIALTTFVF
jgi:Na+/H+ antiporter NhaD/arsenite permease-like protein